MRATVYCIFLTALCLACERQAADDTQPADTAAAAPSATDTGAAQSSGMKTGANFDARTVKRGDKVGSMEVAANNTQAAPQTRLGVTGSVRFEGDLELTGGYRAHFDYPDVQEACFWVDVGDWSKLPRVTGDDRIKWFCFENKQDAIRELGGLGTETRATIVISDYTTNLQPSDVWDTAKLVRVVKKGL